MQREWGKYTALLTLNVSTWRPVAILTPQNVLPLRRIAGSHGIEDWVDLASGLEVLKIIYLLLIPGFGTGTNQPVAYSLY
jgi:hypothetical protein